MAKVACWPQSWWCVRSEVFLEDQLVPLAALLTGVLVVLGVQLKKVEILTNPPSNTLLTLESWEVPDSLTKCWMAALS